MKAQTFAQTQKVAREGGDLVYYKKAKAKATDTFKVKAKANSKVISNV